MYIMGMVLPGVIDDYRHNLPVELFGYCVYGYVMSGKELIKCLRDEGLNRLTRACEHGKIHVKR